MKDHLEEALTDLKQLQSETQGQSVGSAFIAIGEFLTRGYLDRVIDNLETVQQTKTPPAATEDVG